MKRLFCLLLTLVMLMACVPVAASAAPKARATMDQIMKDWNAKPQSARNLVAAAYEYKGAWQCAAFSRYVFVQLYGHTDMGSDKNITKTTETYTEASALLTALKTKATPGDAIRLRLGKKTHIFHLYDIDANGMITIYHSNTDGTTNKAKRSTYAVKELVKTSIKREVTNDALPGNVEMTILHSKKNTAPVGSFTGKVKPCSTHDYYGGICKKCGYEYPYKVNKEKATAYKVTKSGGAPVWSRPYSLNSTKSNTIAKGAYVVVIGSTTNVNEKGKLANKWYLLSDGTWIYSGNVKKDSMPKNVRYANYASGLNMRASASSSAKKIAVIPNGGMITFDPTKTKGSWVYAKYHAKGLSGWVSSKYLTSTAPAPK